MNKPIVLSSVLGGLMLSAALASYWLTPTIKIADQQEKIVLEQMIPRSFGDWRIDPAAVAYVAPSDDTKADLDKIYDQMVNRTYVNSRGQSMMLTVTYGSQQTQDLRAHRQEVCYAAQGFDIQSIGHEALRIANHVVPVTRMFAVKDARKEPVTYWFTMGDKVVLSRTERMLVQLKYSFSGVIPDGMLVRVSNLTPDANAGYQAQKDFLDALMASVDAKTGDRLLGAASAP